MRRSCPECGQPVKEGNLGDHVARVHPGVSRRKYREMGIPAPRGPPGLAALKVPMVILVAALLLAGIVYFAAAPAARGVLSPDHTYYDLGRVPQSVIEHSFPVRNSGGGVLKIVGVQTSCGCTGAYLVIGGQESPRFGMHNNPPWEGLLYPGTGATLVVTYDATYHDDVYVGERSIYVRTDNPSQPEVEFRVFVNEGA